jgi:hypothetical protein
LAHRVDQIRFAKIDHDEWAELFDVAQFGWVFPLLCSQEGEALPVGRRCDFQRHTAWQVHLAAIFLAGNGKLLEDFTAEALSQSYESDAWWSWRSYPLVNKHNYGKIHHFLMGKSTISTGPFSIAMFDITRG